MTEPRDPRDPDESIEPNESNESNEASGSRAVREALDALLSAERDGALESGDAARLGELLAAGPAAPTRRADFERLDEALRGLGTDRIAQARLDRIESALVRRLAANHGAAAADAARVPGAADARNNAGAKRGESQAPIERRTAPRRRFAFGVAAALAAGIVLASLVWMPRGERPVDEAREAEPRLAADAIVEAPRAVDDLETLGIEDASDLEVIEELELLEFLAAREREAGEPQG